MFKELFESKETYWVVGTDNSAKYGPFDEKSENEIKDRFIQMVWNNYFKGDVKLIKTLENAPRDARNYEFKKFNLVMDDNIKLSNKEKERLGL